VTGVEINLGEAHRKASAIADYLSKVGLPNFYGSQRIDAENIRRGYEIIKKRRRMDDQWLRRFLVTCYLDHLCNLYLVRRTEEGYFQKLMRGDIAKKTSSGGMFIVKDLETEQERYESHEISFTAPIYGPKMWWAEGPAGRLEDKILEDAAIDLEELRRLRVRGSKRLGRLIPKVGVHKTPRGLQLSFTLPKGAYATIVLGEIMKNEG
jgi:tRNA pseudouridine13 synthase